MYRNIVLQNSQVRFHEILIKTFTIEELVLCKELEIKVHEKQSEINPFYRNIIISSISEIREMLKDMVSFSDDSEDFKSYQEMMMEEMYKLKECVQYLYPSSLREKKID